MPSHLAPTPDLPHSGPSGRTSVELARLWRQVGRVVALLREVGHAHVAAAKEAALQVHLRLGRALHALKLHKDAHRLLLGEPRLRDLEDHDARDHAVLGALHAHLLLQLLVHLAGAHHVAQHQHARRLAHQLRPGARPLVGRAAYGLRGHHHARARVGLLHDERRGDALAVAAQALAFPPAHLHEQLLRQAHALGLAALLAALRAGGWRPGRRPWQRLPQARPCSRW
mmetsp:Transcript_5891/g.14655  ORF Transcript_5891/g.14655 Transcript_5891/m.14655 type:complete len:227 (-) Transcript_5891:14-694(-)